MKEQHRREPGGPTDGVDHRTDQITVVGLPSKNGLKVLNLRKISWANGEVIPLGPPPEPGQ